METMWTIGKSIGFEDEGWMSTTRDVAVSKRPSRGDVRHIERAPKYRISRHTAPETDLLHIATSCFV